MKKLLSLFAAMLFAGSMFADTFGLVMDDTSFEDGDEIIIVNTDGTQALSTNQKSSNRGAAAVLVENDLIEPGADVQIITIELADGGVMFKVGEDAYLYAASSSSNQLKTSSASTVGANGIWDITIDAEGVASIIATGTNSRKVMQFNGSNAANLLFACYGSATQGALKIYKKGLTPLPTMKYYLIGSMNSWTESNEYKFVKNPSADDEEYMLNVKLPANSLMKVKGIQEGYEPIYYPDGMNNDFEINDQNYYTLYFRPNGDGGNDWYYHYIYAQYHPLINCADASALEENAIAYMNPVQVVYVNGANVYVKDNSGVALYYDYNLGLTAGDVVSGFVGISSPYHGLPELKPYAVVGAEMSVEPGEAPAPEELTAVPTIADVNKYVFIQGVSLVGEFNTNAATNLTATLGEEEFIVRNQFKIEQTFDEGKLYDIVGAVAINNDVIQLYFISAEEHVEPVVVEHYQIVGAYNSWELETAIEFEMTEGVLTANVPDLNGTFKIIQDRGWTNQWGLNPQLGGLVKEVPYAMSPKNGNQDPGNLSLANPFGGYQNAVLTLTESEGEMILTLVEGEFYTTQNNWYIPGEWQGANWACSEAAILAPADEENVYAAHFDDFFGRFKVVYGNWAVEFGAGSEEDKWKLDEDIQLARPCGDLHSEYGDDVHVQDVDIQITVDYENATVVLHMTGTIPEPCEEAYKLRVGANYIDFERNPINTAEFMLLGVELEAGNNFILYNVCSESVFEAVNNEGYQFEMGQAGYHVSESGIYDFYFTPVFENDRLYVSRYLGPTEAAAAPQLNPLQVKAVYSATYEADCNFGEWSSGTQYEQTEYGKHYTTTDLGYFGLTFEDRTLNCSNMEALHLDVWAEQDMSMRVVPIYESTANMGVTISVTAGQWIAIDIPFTSEEWANMGENWSNIYQIKIDNAANQSFWLDNVYFYTTVEPELDEEVPTNVVAQAGDASYFTAYINASAEDNSGEVIFAVMNDELQLATATANSGQEITISVTGLAAGTEYTLKVVAKDPQQNMAEPVEVVVNTLAAPTSAPQPVYAAEDVLAIYGPAYEATVEWRYDNWWSGATQMEGMLSDSNNALCYIPSTEEGGCFSWSFNPQDVTAYSKIALDIYPTNSGSALFRIVNVLGDDVPVELEGGQWNHIELDIAGNTQTQFQQIGILNYKGLGDFFVQNVLFVKEPVVYNYFMVGTFCGWNPANAVMFEDVEGVLTAMIPSMTGGFKIVKYAGETADWGDEFGAHTQGDVIALDPQGEYILKHNNSKDLNVEGRYNNAVFTLTESEGEMVLHFVAGTVDETIYFSIAGDMNNWNNNDDALTFAEAEGVLRLAVEEIHGEFKVVQKGSWHPQFGGPVGAETKDVLVSGQPYTMTLCMTTSDPDASNLLFAPEGWGYRNAVLTLDPATMTLTLVSGELYDRSDNPKTYQIVGGFTNNWSPADAIQFEEVEGVLTAEVADINGTFKIIQDRGWANQWATNWETGAGLVINEPYVLGAKTATAEPANLAFANPFAGYRNAVLTLDPATMTLTLVSGEFYVSEADWYVPGSFLGWNCNEATKFSPVSGQENTFEILVAEFGKDFKIVYGEWMVEFGAPNAETTWMLDTDLPLAFKGDNVHSAYGDQILQDVVITIVVDYENAAVSVNIHSEGEIIPSIYYIKNNWNGGEWEWKQMTPSNNGDEWMYEGVFGGNGVNINTAPEDEGSAWFAIDQIVGEIEAGQTIRFVYSVSANSVTATVVTGIEDVVLDAAKARKMMIDGNIYIIREGRMYNVTGARVR